MPACFRHQSRLTGLILDLLLGLFLLGLIVICDDLAPHASGSKGRWRRR